jgi:ATP-binding cassette subfamily F protein 3
MIDFQNVTKRFGTQTVLDGVSFRIHPGERVGIVGPNGAGKSTLAALLTGDLSPDGGDIQIAKKLRMGFLRQQLRPDQVSESLLEYAENAVPRLAEIEHEISELEAALAAGHTPAESGHAGDCCLEAGADAAEPVRTPLTQAERERALKRLGELQTEFEHEGGYDLRHRAQAILCGLGFSPEVFKKPFRAFSGGWQMRAELTRALLTRPDILILDEPTNYLDVPAVEWLRGYLEAFTGTLLLIAHDRYLLDSLTKVTLEVAGARVTRYQGNYDYYIRERRQRHDNLLAAKENLDRKREQLERFVERFKATASKATQAQSKQKQLDKMEEITLPEEIIHPPHIRLPEPPHCGAEIIRAEKIGVSYDGHRWVLKDVDFRLERGEKAALIGMNGMGKTTLLRVLGGHMNPTAGKRGLGHQVLCGYFSQDFTETMDASRTVFGTARQAAPDMPEKQLRATLGSFRFSGDAVEKTVSVLSGGEKSRLALLRLLVRPANFLILDEPTSHLDIASREVLERALREYAGTLLIVSHDIEFVRKTATTIFFLDEKGLTRYYGDYDYFRAKRAAEQSGSAAAESAKRADGAEPAKAELRKEQKREEAQRRNELYKKRKPLEDEVARCEKLIAKLEAEQTDITEKLYCSTEALDFPALNRRLADIQAELAASTASWEKSAMELEALLSEAG